MSQSKHDAEEPARNNKVPGAQIPPDSAEDTAASANSFRHSNLVDVRNRLLDLTARNRLLSHKHTQTKSLRFVAITTEDVWSALNNNSVVAIAPVPEPTDEEREAAGYLEYDPETGECLRDERPKASVWAEHLGIHTDYDLEEVPSTRVPNDSSRFQLQTLDLSLIHI